jgi:8-oxo-dGTP diphosphatase
MSDFSNMSTKPDTPKVGVGVLLKKSDGAVLLGKRKGSHGEGEWSLPGGHLEIGETFEDCCRREVFEETGMRINQVIHIDFANNIMESEGLHYVTLYFIANWVGSQEPQLKEPDKCEKWEWCTEVPIPTFGKTRQIVELVWKAEGISSQKSN